jgi:hypothetical protein
MSSEMGKELLGCINEPLLQHGEMERAKVIKNPESIPDDLLNLWLGFATQLCNHQQYKCLAFTQLNENIRQKLGFSDRLPPRAIYYRTDMTETGLLIVNPEISTDNFIDNTKLPVFEGCGSISHGEIYYFINRPYNYTLGGYIFNGTEREEYTVPAGDPYTDLSIHEVQHLNAKTAFSYPELIYDIRKWEDWKSISDVYVSKRFSEEQLRQFINDTSPNGLLVYGKKEKQFIIVNANGKFICEYPISKY